MKREEARQFFKEKFDEISVNEYQFSGGDLRIKCDEGPLFFREKEKPETFVFEDEFRKIEVNKDGNLVIKDEYNNWLCMFNKSIPILKEAIAFSDKIRSEK